MSVQPLTIEQVTRELAAREPIFHRAEHASSPDDCERMMAGDFWEVGASGRVYSREFVLETLAGRDLASPDDHWAVTDFACRQISPEVWLATYQLEQHAGRLSRRSTLWRFTTDGWKVLYHQGTLIQL